MKRFLVCLVCTAAVPGSLTGVDQAARQGEHQLAVACALLALVAIATLAWTTAQVGMAFRSTFGPGPQYRRGRWTGRDGGGWL